MNVLVALFVGVQILGLLVVLAAYRRAPVAEQTERGFEVVREAPSAADSAPVGGAVVRVAG